LKQLDGFSVPGLERLHAAAEQHVGAERVPGLVALVARGEQVHVEAQRGARRRRRSPSRL
jgi:hypothetical protein